MTDYQALSDIKKLDELLKSFSRKVGNSAFTFFMSAENYQENISDDYFEIIQRLFNDKSTLKTIHN